MDVMMRNKIMLLIYCLMATLQIFTEIVGAEDTRAESVLKTLLKNRVVQNTAGDSLAKATTMKPTAEMTPTAMYVCHGLSDGKMYKIGDAVASGISREGCGFALVCVEGGHLRTFWEQSCRLALLRDTPTPRTIGTPRPAWSGCVFEGKLYHFGEMIQSGQCYSTMCDYSGQIIHGDNFNCLKTLLTPPPTPNRNVTPPIIHVG